MALLLYLLVLPTAWLLYNCHCLHSNYVKATALGLPYIISPITPDNPLWIALQTAFGDILQLFPFNATTFTRHIRLGWEFHDRYQTHSRLGDAWILVTPARNWLPVAEPRAVAEIHARNKDFIHPSWMVEALAVFGPNVATAEGQDWQRQRKLTATPFNEQKSPLVWQESLRQAQDMLRSWCASSPNGFTTTPEDTRTLALHVLSYVAFQKSYPFESTSKTIPTDAKSLTYRDALSIILNNVLVVLVVPRFAFSLSCLPIKWRRIGWAIQAFRDYMSQQLSDEQQLTRTGKAGTGTLVSNLARAGRQANDNKNAWELPTVAEQPLTEAEILGNIFVFNFAGHDTTAISLVYAVLLMVANPEVQDWIHDELEYFVRDADISSLDYSNMFPKLKRCLAVLLETLRLYNPIPGAPKYTGEKAAYIELNGHSRLIPGDTLVVPALQTLHTDPRYWGQDSLVWRPQRWIVPSQADSDSANPDAEEFRKPEKGTYFPWSEGLRNCPGKKFAQVEFVAVMATLFKDHVAEPVPKQGETLMQARNRTLDVVKDSNVELLLKMQNPGSVSVQWKERT